MKKALVILFIVGMTGFMPVKINAQQQFKVVLDAGHGGTDPGNTGNGYLEKDIVLKIALEVILLGVPNLNLRFKIVPVS